MSTMLDNNITFSVCAAIVLLAGLSSDARLLWALLQLLQWHMRLMAF